MYQLDPFHTPRVSGSVWICLNLKGFASLCGTMWHPNSHPLWGLEGPGGNPIFWKGDVLYNVDEASFLCYTPPPLNPGFGFERVDSWRNSRKTHAISFRRWWETVLKSCKLVMKIHVSTSDFGGFCRASQIPYPRLEFMDALQEITATAAPGRMLMNKNQT